MIGVDEECDKSQNLSFQHRLPISIWEIILDITWIGERKSESLYTNTSVYALRFAMTKLPLPSEARMVEAGLYVPTKSAKGKGSGRRPTVRAGSID